MKFVELAADFVRQKGFRSQVIKIKILTHDNKGVFWVGYPKPSLWFAHSDFENQDLLYYTFYQPKGRRKLKQLENDLGPYSSRYGFSIVSNIHDPEIFNKIMEIIINPPQFIDIDYEDLPILLYHKNQQS
jgi:hypothetical protein